MATLENPPQTPSPSQVPLGSDLVKEYERIFQEKGRRAVLQWEVNLSQAEWEALMEAKRTGLKAQ